VGSLNFLLASKVKKKFQMERHFVRVLEFLENLFEKKIIFSKQIADDQNNPRIRV
jgi:hypothetical protein